MRWLQRAALYFLQQLSPKEAGLLFEKLQIEYSGKDPRIGAYALEYNNPQALCFLLNVYPDLQDLFSRFERLGEVSFLDIGPAFGASAGLLSEMHRSHFLGPKLKVEVLDITGEREAFIHLTYPHVHFHLGRIEAIESHLKWDMTYCSNAIEHMADPDAFIEAVVSRTKGFACFLAPYDELEPMSPGHISRITEDVFARFDLERLRIFKSAGWPTTAEGLDRQQIFAVLRGRA